VISLMVAAMQQYDAGANQRDSVIVNTAAASDTNLGNISTFHPIRAAYSEVDFIDNPTVDALLNTGANAAAVKTAVADAIRNGIIQDIRIQPQP
jgi:hypothetical protein